ncbi:Glycosidase [Clostridium cavendishii DSM 21758]|uniref:Glycosidase n=1 Tax=Clostridium cavendishii DSM 21758 TaxID=1121302 RepID=A0A1M6AHE2_9CLOT|nr:alpha-amylase family glycosyl hydrolase [Clostridium cavendishii]SHI35837.1 Glycosidase [Clostridium cavendishii DSM 21758]
MGKWVDKAIVYQVYPLGFCGALYRKKDDDMYVNRLSLINDEFIDHLKNIGINTIYLGPIFESSYHGYDTSNYFKIDSRLGNNNDFKNLSKKLHENNLRVILDGVFNHVGREFWAFKDVIRNRNKSKYKDWFYINFNSNNNYNDGLSYSNWEGHNELVKLNLSNVKVKEHIFNAIKYWVNEFNIDGIRLDVAYSLDREFLIEVKNLCSTLNDGLWLIGEMIHGDYNSICNKDMLDAVTNYECYKGIYSSHNDKNYFEIAYSFNRQFGNYGIYKNCDFYNFVDNHDVDRIASILKDKELINNVYAMLYTMKGKPAIYYGSEFLIEGSKKQGDEALRPNMNLKELKASANNKEVLENISKLSQIRMNNKAIQEGEYKQLFLSNNQFAFARIKDEEFIIVAFNIGEEYEFRIKEMYSFLKFIDLMTKEVVYISDSLIKFRVGGKDFRILRGYE